MLRCKPYLQKSAVLMITENSLVRYKNSLNRASYDLDAFELRIILAAVAQLPPGELASDCWLSVDAQDLVQIGVDPKNAYSALKKACDTLFDRYITWRTEDEDGDEVVIKTRWLQEVAYIDQKGRLKIQFSKRVAEHLDRLLPNITQFAYLELHSISGAYAIRLYQLLAQFQHGEEKRLFIKVDDLKERLSIGDKYKTYSKFKQGVLEQAIREINEAPYTAFKVRMSDKERGCKDSRKVVCLHFYILPKEQSVSKTQPPEEVLPPSKNFLTVEQATLTARQRKYYSELLSGDCSKEKLEIAGFHVSTFVSFLYTKGFASFGLFSGADSNERLQKWLYEKLSDSRFVMAIFDPWLRKFGFRPRS